MENTHPSTDTPVGETPNIPDSQPSHGQDNNAAQLPVNLFSTIGDPTPSPSENPTVIRQTTQALDDNDPNDSQVKRRVTAFTIRPQGLKEYNGKSIAECREFIRICGITFRIDPGSFQEDNRKILYAEQFLRGDTAEAWATDSQEFGEAGPTWPDFCVFLLNLVQHPDNRARETATNYENAVQKPNQTVIEFANYLDRLEAYLPKYSEEHRYQHLLAKLRPGLRKALVRIQNIPKDRRSLIAVAASLEQNGEGGLVPKKTNEEETRYRTGSASGKSRSQPHPTSGSSSEGHNRGSKRPRESAESSTKTPPSKKSRIRLSQEERNRLKEENLCFRCAKPGHLAADCKFNPGEVSKDSRTQTTLANAQVSNGGTETKPRIELVVRMKTPQGP